MDRVRHVNGDSLKMWVLKAPGIGGGPRRLKVKADPSAQRLSYLPSERARLQLYVLGVSPAPWLEGSRTRSGHVSPCPQAQQN